MNFDKNPNLKKKNMIIIGFFFVVWGGGGGGLFRLKKKPTKTIGIRVFFCSYSISYKISSFWLKWFSSFSTNKRSNGQVRGITLPMFYGIQSKVKSHLNMDPKQYSEFQDPSSSNSLHIVLTRFFYCYNSKV